MDVAGMDTQPVSTMVSELGAGDDQSQQWGRDKKSKGKTVRSLDDVKSVILQLLYNNNNKTVDRTFEQIEQKTHLKREQVIFS